MHSFKSLFFFLYIYRVNFSQEILFRLASLKRQSRILNSEQLYFLVQKARRLVDYTRVAIMITELNNHPLQFSSLPII